MRVLNFGNSDSRGDYLPAAEADAAWPHLLRRELPPQCAEEVDFFDCVLNPNSAIAPAFIEARLQQHAPDVVIVNLLAYHFAVQVVAGRVRQVFGDRAGRWFMRRQRHLDARVARTGRLGTRSLFATRRAVRAVVGTAPMLSYEAALESHSTLLRRLAREEQLDVVIISCPSFAAIHHRLNRPLTERLERFNRTLRAVADEHHFAWVDNEAVFAVVADRESIFLPDGLHRRALGHRLLADALLPVLAGFATSPASTATGRR